MGIDVRTSTDADREALHRLSQQAFTARPAPFDEEADRAGLPLDRRLVATDRGAVVGRLGTWQLAQWFGGREVAMGGISGVAVEPAARGRGVAGALLRRAIADQRERGEVLSTLYPMNHGLYRGYGWEVAGAHPEQEIDTQVLAALPRPSGPVNVRPAVAADLDGVLAVYRRVACTEPGNLRPGHLFAELRLLARPNARDAYVAEVDGVVTGWVTLTHADPTSPREMYSLSASHLVATDRDSELALWRLLGSHHPIARTARVVLPAHASMPTLHGERSLRPTGPGWCWMTRLVDAPGAIAARGYAEGVDVEIQLDVDDPLVPEHAGPHVLRVSGGAGTLERGGSGRVRVGVGVLASLYTGWSDAGQLSRWGLLDGGRDSDVAALRQAFGGQLPWMREFF